MKKGSDRSDLRWASVCTSTGESLKGKGEGCYVISLRGSTVEKRKGVELLLSMK